MRLNWVGSISSKEQDRNLRNVLLVDQVASFSERCSKKGAFHVGFSVRASVQIENQPCPVAARSGILKRFTEVGKERIAAAQSAPFAETSAAGQTGEGCFCDL
jgi:hypothetical protein